MKFLSVTMILAAAALAGCSTTANNGANTGNANLRGQNTNTAYISNADSNVKPPMPTNVTNITPGNMTNGNTANTNANANANANANKPRNTNK